MCETMISDLENKQISKKIGPERSEEIENQAETLNSIKENVNELEQFTIYQKATTRCGTFVQQLKSCSKRTDLNNVINKARSKLAVDNRNKCESNSVKTKLNKCEPNKIIDVDDITMVSRKKKIYTVAKLYIGFSETQGLENFDSEKIFSKQAGKHLKERQAPMTIRPRPYNDQVKNYLYAELVLTTKYIFYVGKAFNIDHRITLCEFCVDNRNIGNCNIDSCNIDHYNINNCKIDSCNIDSCKIDNNNRYNNVNYYYDFCNYYNHTKAQTHKLIGQHKFIQKSCRSFEVVVTMHLQDDILNDHTVLHKKHSHRRQSARLLDNGSYDNAEQRLAKILDILHYWTISGQINIKPIQKHKNITLEDISMLDDTTMLDDATISDDTIMLDDTTILDDTTMFDDTTMLDNTLMLNDIMLDITKLGTDSLDVSKMLYDTIMLRDVMELDGYIDSDDIIKLKTHVQTHAQTAQHTDRRKCRCGHKHGTCVRGI
ncbi:hypothetical protein HELRODRAFT_167764 [Helobdella robusta]|uniref:Uncharacterized protein n=1 Tax=Helobdella robusta TaxID=6412 RepID=T1EZS0_HELRO|nr:hypothetical protein HELRODRAFT_167764 [Helobdella robusta]ESO09937.1 hypothetical protein HELRODRAFT_167764 [Helobdella robusta]